MKTLLLSFLLLSAIMAFGQTAPGVEWSKTYGGLNSDDAAAIAATSDHGFIIAGSTNSNDGDVSGVHDTNGDYWIIKIDSLGIIQWQKCLGGTQGDAASSIQQTTDGGFIVAGSSYSSDGDVTGHHGIDYNTDCWVVKLSAAGDIEWQKSLGGSAADGAAAVRVISDGGYIIAGYTYSIDGDVTGHQGSEGNYDFWVVKLDSAGAIQWQKCLGSSFYDVAKDIQVTPDGGYIVVGEYRGADDEETGTPDDYDYWVVKLNSTGSIEWQKNLGGTNNDRATSVQVATDGGYIIAGYSLSNNGDVTGNHNNSYDYWVVKLTSTGILQWQKSLGGGETDEATCIQAAQDGGYLVSGFSASNNGDITGNHGLEDCWVVKLTATGVIQWQKSLGGSKNDVSRGICLAPDGSYLLTGYTYSTDGDVGDNKGSYDVWAVKLSPDAILPVTLTSFNAQKQHTDVLLQWQTATEVNSKQFNIQRSSNGSRFTTIGTTPAAGNSTSLTRYIYTDANAASQPGTLYYRLEQVDKDGSKYYSKVAVIKNKLENAFTIMPNPVKSTIRIQSKINAAKATVQLSDMNGKVIYFSNKAISAGYFEVRATNLAAGTYNLAIQANGDKCVLRVVKE